MSITVTAAREVRRFNRFYTQRMGLLNSGLLHSPFSLAEVRVLYEIAHRNRPTARVIAGELQLDEGYLSRILRGLRQRGLSPRAPRRTTVGSAGSPSRPGGARPSPCSMTALPERLAQCSMACPLPPSSGS